MLTAEAPARTANVLGAVALALTDRLSEAAGMPMSGAAALSALRHVLGSPAVHALGSPAIHVLGEVPGVSHSGAVQLVDGLAAAGHVTRAPGPDGRTSAIALTAAGADADAGVHRVQGRPRHRPREAETDSGCRRGAGRRPRVNGTPALPEPG